MVGGALTKEGTGKKSSGAQQRTDHVKIRTAAQSLQGCKEWLVGAVNAKAVEQGEQRAERGGQESGWAGLPRQRQLCGSLSVAHESL